jgi:hypothetical protein
MAAARLRQGRDARAWTGATIAALLLATAPRLAAADEPPPGTATATTKARVIAVVLPAVVDDGTRRKPAAAETDLAALLVKLDELLAETARDLGLTLDGARPELPDPTTVSDTGLFDLAARTGGPVITATLRSDGADVELRIALASPSHRAVRTRTERFPKDDLTVRAVVMLRDVVTDGGFITKAKEAVPSAPSLPGQLAVPARSEGRTALAINATLFGGMMGFSVERASGSNDPRLLYPLLAVGAGVGLGASLLIADEWDVGNGDAWFLSSGALWPTAAAHLIYEGRFGNASGHPGPEGDRWAFGLVGGTLGLTFSTLSLALGDMSEGGAVLAHSGGVFGLAFGGMTEWLVRGDTRTIPFAGMGYGAALGWLAAASAATARLNVTPTRVLSIDLGAVLGGLAGAALASPLVFDGPTSNETRGWVGAAAGGVLVGTGVALWLTRAPAPARSEQTAPIRIAGGLAIHPNLPEIGAIAESTVGDTTAPVFGVRFGGRW